MPQFDLTNFNRFILDTENDADSPDNEELMQQYMYNIVGLLILMLDTGISGSATADPTNVANSVFTDAVAVWTDDLHNGRTLLMTSGTCKGLFYKILDTDDAGNTLTINDNLFAEGVRNGDTYKILYDLIDNLDGHDHDGVNSRKGIVSSIYTGTYTGDGSLGQAIAGVPFPPKYVRIWRHAPIDFVYNSFEKLDQTWGDLAYQHIGAGGHATDSDQINSLNSDGFTVDDAGVDADPNANGIPYDYLALG
ncbi:hypothetical protein KKH23_06665 [Patescibacteria group bacterium]|nr:hypothetical protein [Patescibacteria group bacterium]